MSPDAFLAWEARQERKHELVGGVVRLMAGATRAHLQVQRNLLLTLSPKLKGGPCEALQELRVKVPNRNYRYADVAVDCGTRGRGDLVASGPTVIFEVDSPSTGFLEEIDRLADYQSVETVEHIVVLSQDAPLARVWTRVDGGWTTADADGLEASLSLPRLDLSLAMAEIYEDVVFMPPAED
jgi:Uma2 family endonuclease